MRQSCVVFRLCCAIAILFGSIQWVMAQSKPDAAGVPVSMVVTANSHHSSDMPNISSANVVVRQGHARAEVTDWVPLQGDRSNLELFLLLDDARLTGRGSQVEDISHFIMAQPATTKIGIVYMQTGGPNIVQGLTADHALAAGALHVPTGDLAKSASPYLCLRDLIKQWPVGKDRREILMVSSGDDEVYVDSGSDKGNIYVDSAIEEAQRGGIVVSTIGTSGEEPGGEVARRSGEENGMSRVSGGRNYYLAKIAEETGGESYHHPFGAPISFAPYLEDSTRRLTRQYLLTFLAKPGKKSGMQTVQVRTNVPHLELVSAEKVYVPVTQSN